MRKGAAGGRGAERAQAERPAPRETPPYGLILALAVLLAALIVVAFLPAFSAQFLNFDDDKLYTLSYRWRGLDAARLQWMAGTTQMGHYQPLTWLSVAIDHALYGLTTPAYPEAGAYHATSVAWHVLAALALFALTARLLRLALPTCDAPSRVVGAAIVAALWALHPLRVESVVWLTERRDVVSAPFFFLALYAWLGWAAAPRKAERSASTDHAVVAAALIAGVAWWSALDLSTPGQVRLAGPTLAALGTAAWLMSLGLLMRRSARAAWLGLAAGCMLLSLLGKAWAMVLPGLFVVLDAWPLRRLTTLPARALVAEKLPFIVPALLFAGLAHAAQSGALGVVKSWAEHPLGARVAQASYGVLYYPAKTVAPFDLQPLYRLPPGIGFEAWPWLLAVVGALALLAAVIAGRRAAPAVAAAFAAYALIVAPVLGFTQSGPQLVADRYAYLAGAPLTMLAAGGLAWRGLPRRAALAIAAALLLALGVATYRQATYWQTSLSLWERAHALDPDNPSALTSLGVLRTQQAQAERDPQRARQLLDDALAMQQRAYQLDGSALALRNLSQVETLLSLADPARDLEHKRAALDYARRAVELATAQNRLSADFLYAYGIDLVNLGELGPGIEQLQRAVALDPDATRVLINLGQTLTRAGRAGEALAPLQRATQLEPRDARAWAALAGAYEATRDRQQARAAWQRVLALVPNDPTANQRAAALAEGR